MQVEAQKGRDVSKVTQLGNAKTGQELHSLDPKTLAFSHSAPC